MVRTKSDATSGNDVNRFSHAKDNGFLGSVNSPTMVGERMVEGLDVDFQLQPGLSNNSEISVQVLLLYYLLFQIINIFGSS